MAITLAKSSDVTANKARYKAKCERHLAKHKTQRLEKYGNTSTTELSRTTLVLFTRWGHRADECKAALKAKRFKRAPKNIGTAPGRWA